MTFQISRVLLDEGYVPTIPRSVIGPARGLAGFLLASTVLGGLMFFPTFRALTAVYFCVTAVTLAVFTFSPRPVPPAVRTPFALLAIASLLLSAYQISRDIPRDDWGGLLFRVLGCLIYLIMFSEIASRRGKEAPDR